MPKNPVHNSRSRPSVLSAAVLALLAAGATTGGGRQTEPPATAPADHGPSDQQSRPQDVPESITPSESLSADKAVRFPVDI